MGKPTVKKVTKKNVVGAEGDAPVAETTPAADPALEAEEAAPEAEETAPEAEEVAPEAEAPAPAPEGVSRAATRTYLGLLGLETVLKVEPVTINEKNYLSISFLSGTKTIMSQKDYDKQLQPMPEAN